MKKGCLNSLFLGSALGLFLVTVSPPILATETLKPPLSEVNTLPVPGLVKEKEKEKEKLSYRLVYADHSPLKTIPLNNTDIKIRVYANGSPRGDKELKTNEEAEFDFDKMPKNHRTYIGMSLIKIHDDSKNKQACQGYFIKTKNELVVTCHQKG